MTSVTADDRPKLCPGSGVDAYLAATAVGSLGLGDPELDSAVVGVIGALLGVLIGAASQQVQASRSRHWQQADLLRTVKRRVYAEYLRSVSASYAQALSGHRSRTEDASLLAATAEIEVLSGTEVSVPARELTNFVIGVHSSIAAGDGVPESDLEDADERRHKLIDIFKADLKLKPAQRWTRIKLWRARLITVRETTGAGPD